MATAKVVAVIVGSVVGAVMAPALISKVWNGYWFTLGRVKYK